MYSRLRSPRGQLPGSYLAAIWQLPGSYLAVIWRLFGAYLAAVSFYFVRVLFRTSSISYEFYFKPASLKTLFTDTKENTTSEYSERQQRIKAERKQAATPASRYNFVQLAVPSTVPKFKPPTLNMPSTPGPDS
uniref:Uncharacterized protein n=1 Tax=Caenorhabditis japonica TaxID=281687 RepID=A0A8R1DNI6_CAEJA